MQQNKILVTNDDGFRSQGINTLYKHVNEVSPALLFAPNADRSACSSQLSTRTPLRVVKEGENCYSCTGTPADCVHIVQSNYFSFMPLLVVSGINHGANIGDDVFYSGTIAAAIEGRFFAYPSIAISLIGNDPQHFDTAGMVAARLLRKILVTPHLTFKVLNVNVPDIPFADIQGYRVTSLGKRGIPEPATVCTDGRGNEIIWIGRGSSPTQQVENSDFDAVQNGYVSITPLSLNMTETAECKAVKEFVSDV